MACACGNGGHARQRAGELDVGGGEVSSGVALSSSSRSSSRRAGLSPRPHRRRTLPTHPPTHPSLPPPAHASLRAVRSRSAPRRPRPTRPRRRPPPRLPPAARRPRTCPRARARAAPSPPAAEAAAGSQPAVASAATPPHAARLPAVTRAYPGRSWRGEGEGQRRGVGGAGGGRVSWRRQRGKRARRAMKAVCARPSPIPQLAHPPLLVLPSAPGPLRRRCTCTID